QFGRDLVVIGGPCSAETATQVDSVAAAVARAGGHALRGGAFKPRTSPYSFQGLGEPGLMLLRHAADAEGLPLVSEAMCAEEVELVARHAHMVQIGSRNMQNFRLLEAVGRCDTPVLLKRGFMARVDEMLAAAEYIYCRGNTQIVLCERGIRGFDPTFRNILDLSGLVWL
ncbi:MAG: N-acetylneuraminate synthase family protein, partial [Calditrichaeota bacterium]|nr:N-acetylneuraminate synthase family protein [Calditrichota bacterium]